MLLVSIDLEYNNSIIKDIRKSNRRINTQIFIDDDLNYKYRHKYFNCDFVITEYNSKKIDYFASLGKKIIVCKLKRENLEKKYISNDNIFICNSKKELLELIKSQIKNKNKVSHKIMRKVVPITLIILIIFSVFIGFNNTNLLDKKQIQKVLLKEKEKSKEKKVEKKSKEKSDLKKENFLFLGDSITDFYDLKKFYDDLPVVNSGKSGEQTSGILESINTRAVRYNPTKVFLLIGTNDIAFTDIENEELVDRIIRICDDIHKARKKTEIYVESIYPVNRNDNDNEIVDIGMVGRRDNARIKEINALLKEKVEERNYKYLDMYKVLEDDDGNLNLDYTKDGLHMSDDGYDVITSEIKKIIYGNDKMGDQLEK